MDDKKTIVSPQRDTEHAHVLLLLRVIWRNLWAIVLAAVIFGCVGYVVEDVRYVPQYQTRTTFVVHQRGSSSTVYGNLNAAASMAQSFSQVLKSDVMRKRVAEDLGVTTVNGDINASVISETNLLELRITASTPRMAYQLTRSVLDQYDALTGAALNNISLEILQRPTVPTRPINSSDARHMMRMAALVGAVLMAAYIGVNAYLRDTVKSESDVEMKLDTRLLTVLHHERKNKTLKDAVARRKKSLLISDPTTGFLYVETVKKLRSRVEYTMRRTGAKVILVTSVMENEGKTTVATNLAIAMGRKYRNVLLIDGDMKKPAVHKVLEYQNEDYSTLAELIKGKVKLRDALMADSKRHIYTLLSRKGSENSSQLLRSERMEQLLEAAKRQMDVVIIDTPPMAASADGEIIAQLADAAILVVRQDSAPVRIINDTIDVLNRSNAELLGCVLNNFYVADFSENISYGFGGRYGYGYAAKQGYGAKYGYSAGSGEEVRE